MILILVTSLFFYFALVRFCFDCDYMGFVFYFGSISIYLVGRTYKLLEVNSLGDEQWLLNEVDRGEGEARSVR